MRSILVISAEGEAGKMKKVNWKFKLYPKKINFLNKNSEYYVYKNKIKQELNNFCSNFKKFNNNLINTKNKNTIELINKKIEPPLDDSIILLKLYFWYFFCFVVCFK